MISTVLSYIEQKLGKKKDTHETVGGIFFNRENNTTSKRLKSYDVNTLFDGGSVPLGEIIPIERIDVNGKNVTLNDMFNGEVGLVPFNGLPVTLINHLIASPSFDALAFSSMTLDDAEILCQLLSRVVVCHLHIGSCEKLWLDLDTSAIHYICDKIASGAIGIRRFTVGNPYMRITPAWRYMDIITSKSTRTLVLSITYRPEQGPSREQLEKAFQTSWLVCLLVDIVDTRMGHPVEGCFILTSYIRNHLITLLKSKLKPKLLSRKSPPRKPPPISKLPAELFGMLHSFFPPFEEGALRRVGW